VWYVIDPIDGRLGHFTVNDHRSVGSLVKEALERYPASKRARGEPLEGRGGGFWVHLVFAFIIVALCLYYFFA